TNPLERRGQRQAVMVGGRLVVDWPWRNAVELRGDYPIVFDVRTSDSAVGGRAPGFTAGAGIRAPIYTVGIVSMGILVSYRYIQDAIYTSDGRNSVQNLNRFGVNAEVSFVDAKPPPKPTRGSIVVQVTEAGKGGSVPGISVVLKDHPEMKFT